MVTNTDMNSICPLLFVLICVVLFCNRASEARGLPWDWNPQKATKKRVVVFFLLISVKIFWPEIHKTNMFLFAVRSISIWTVT